MLKVLLVDDEVLALGYLKELVDWEDNGYQIVGCATSGEEALMLYKKFCPEIIISDIRMVGMDGLELVNRLRQMHSEASIILLSAYKEFEYAKKGIQYGVKNYLLKHELSEETLLNELELIKMDIEQRIQKGKVYEKYFANQLIYSGEKEELENVGLGNRFALIMIHRNSEFCEGNFHEQELSREDIESIRDVLEEELENTIFYVSDMKIAENNMVILYRIEKEVSKYRVNYLIEKKSNMICTCLKNIREQGINVLYSYEITQKEISVIFRRMAAQIRYAVFWRVGKSDALDRLSNIPQEEKKIWEEQVTELKNIVYGETSEVENAIKYLFEQVVYPVYQLAALKELIYLLEVTLRRIEEKEGITRVLQQDKIYKVDAIENYYIEQYSFAANKVNENQSKKYSKIVLDMMRYIRKNYYLDLNLELLGEVFQMNGVYLGQLFKRETNTTFLKFLTALRIEEAKRLLETGAFNVSEVAEKVGYKTGQYFSQIFIKSVGMKPQEYKKWSENKERKKI